MAEVLGHVTRAMVFYADKLWLDSVTKAIESLFPGMQEGGFMTLVLYAVAITIAVLVIKRLLAKVVPETYHDYEPRDHKNFL